MKGNKNFGRNQWDFNVEAPGWRFITVGVFDIIKTFLRWGSGATILIMLIKYWLGL